MVRGSSVGCAALAGRRENMGQDFVLDDPETAFLDVLFVGPKRLHRRSWQLFSTSDSGEEWSEVAQTTTRIFTDREPTTECLADRRVWYGGAARPWQAWSPGCVNEGIFWGLPWPSAGGGVRLRGIFTERGRAVWQKIETRTNALLHGGTTLRDGRMVLTAGAGELLLSENSGQSFSVVPLPDKAAKPISLGRRRRWPVGDY